MGRQAPTLMWLFFPCMKNNATAEACLVGRNKWLWMLPVFSEGRHLKRTLCINIHNYLHGESDMVHLPAEWGNKLSGVCSLIKNTTQQRVPHDR